MFNQNSGGNSFASGLPGFLTGIGQLFGSGFGAMGGNPYSGAQNYLNQIPGQLQQYLGPYIGAGMGPMNQYINNGLGQGQGLQNQFNQMMGQGQGLQNQYNQLMNDPTGFINKIMASYQASPQYQNEVNAATTGANRAAAAGGMLGSPAEQSQLGQAIQNYAAQDQQNYLNNALGAYGMGLEGQQGMFNQGLAGSQGLYNTGAGLTGQQYGAGANAAGQLSQGLNQNTMNQMLMNYLQHAQARTDKTNAIGGVLGGLGGLFGSGVLGDIGKFLGGIF